MSRISRETTRQLFRTKRDPGISTLPRVFDFDGEAYTLEAFLQANEKVLSEMDHSAIQNMLPGDELHFDNTNPRSLVLRRVS